MLRYLRNRARLRSVMSASGGKADIPFESMQCLLLTQSGLSLSEAFRTSRAPLICKTRASRRFPPSSRVGRPRLEREWVSYSPS